MKKRYISVFVSLFFSVALLAQGSWTPLNNQAPDNNYGVMLLLSDGTVMAKTLTCSTCDTIGNVWNLLTPDTTGSYINGTWTSLAPMHDTRLFFASQVLKDGRVFVAGGEYGSGKSTAETYNPLTDTWTMAPNLGKPFLDANSEILEDGRVLTATLDGYGKYTSIYNPVTNAWGPGPTCHGSHDESVWVKLPDKSILFVDFGRTTSERYIPATNQWVTDAIVPVALYDPYWYETGAGFLLPDGRAFFLGATGHTAYYTPSGSTAAGSWQAGPDFPIVDLTQYGTTDAAAAMMPNGKILCLASPINTSSSFDSSFLAPTRFFEFNYTTNEFTQIAAPDGSDYLDIPCFYANLLDLPDGNILFTDGYTNQYYIYTPDGNPVVNGKPTINSVTAINCDTFKVDGTLFNGISEGAAYGDDWQMASNYPIVKFTNVNNRVYYMRSFNWNSTGVMRGNLPDSTLFTLPYGLPFGTYSVTVTANGISSDPMAYTYTTCITSGIKNNSTAADFSLYPNPASTDFLVVFSKEKARNIYVYDILGNVVLQHVCAESVRNQQEIIDVSELMNGIYFVEVNKHKQKIIVQH